MGNNGYLASGSDYIRIFGNSIGSDVERQVGTSTDVLQLRTSECGAIVDNQSVNPKVLRDEANIPWLKTAALGSKVAVFETKDFITYTEKIDMKEALSGTKHDQDKSRVDLIDPEFLEGLGNVLRFGANKYSPHNWRGGIKYSRLIGAAFRHLMALSKGEDMDAESGLGHVFHLACCVMFLSWHLSHKPELDDRFKY